MEPLGVGLVGYGGIGRLHALCLRMLPLAYPELPPAPIVAVATRSEETAERARRELGQVFVTTSLDALLTRPGVAIIDCCTPTADHARVALAAVAAGKLLFCEKPLAASVAEAEAIVTAAQANGRVGGVNFHFRQVPALQEAGRRIAAGLLGEVYSFHLRYYRASNIHADRPLTWRFAGPGAGVLVDLGSHLIDLVEHLLGEITSVSARTRTVVTSRPGPDGKPLTVEGDDIAWLEFVLADGGHGTLEVSKLVPGAADDLRIEAYGSNGSLVFDTRDPNGLYLAEGAGASIGGQRIGSFSRNLAPATLPPPESSSGVVQWHLASLAAFVRAIAMGTPPEPGLADGLRVQRVIAAALQSASQGGRAVLPATA